MGVPFKAEGTARAKVLGTRKRRQTLGLVPPRHAVGRQELRLER